ncbi:YbaB/EbfC family nucleoid-associated protein [Actinokineospora sp. NPDC004072]
MTGREPVERSTRRLIEDSRARQEALANVEKVLAEVTGTAYDHYQTVRVTVDGRGRMLELWLRPDAVRWGPDLGGLIVQVAHAAMANATQAGYNRLAPLLGDDLTRAVELISGHAAPARRGERPSITAEEFQRRRDARLADQRGPHQQAGADDDGDDPLSLDLSFLRSDR